MAVGDYVFARADRPSMGDPIPNHRPPWQAPAEAAGVEPSHTRHVGTSAVNGTQSQQLDMDPERHKSVFDTDVEGVDDSTITATSVNEIEDRHDFVPSLFHQHVSQKWIGSTDSEIDHLEGFGQAEENQSRLPDSPEEDEDADDEETQILDWIPQAYRSSGGTPGIRRDDQSRLPSRAPSRMNRDQMDAGKVTSTRFISTSDMTRTVQLPYRNGHRSQQSLATTPTNRFNFKTERSYERLIQQSPTRRASGPRPQPGRQNSSSPQKRDKQRVEGSFRTQDYEEPVDHRVGGAFDATDDEGFDDTTVSLDIQIPEQSKTSKTTSSIQEKTRFESDYPQEVLRQMTFSDLENEPFDYIPAPPTSKPSSPPPSLLQPNLAQTAAERLDLVKTLSEADRYTYLSSQSITEWEEFGDQLIDEFSAMLTKIKEARQARRKTTALFEAEIKRRHEEMQKRDAELDKKLAEMKEGGMGVLRGANP